MTGDSAYRDQDDYYSILGRVDDVVNISGHRLSTAEIESALLDHGKLPGDPLDVDMPSDGIQVLSPKLQLLVFRTN